MKPKSKVALPSAEKKVEEPVAGSVTEVKEFVKNVEETVPPGGYIVYETPVKIEPEKKMKYPPVKCLKCGKKVAFDNACNGLCQKCFMEKE